MGSRVAEVLLGLHASPAHKGQQAAWELDLKAFEVVKADDEEELRRVRGEAYQVAGLYAMFQGVIFTAISQPNRLSCALSWCPISLSLAVSFATILAIADKLYSMGQLQEDINESDRCIGVLMESLDFLHIQGASFNLDSAQPKQEIARREHAGFRRIFGSGDAIVALLFLVGFSFLIAIFSLKTLCHRRHCCP